MLNLILKDILVQKKTLAFLGLYIIVFIFAFQSIGAGAFSAIVIAVTYQMVSSVSNYEEKANSDIIMNSLPLSRKGIVFSKYLSIIVYALLAILGYMAFSLIITLIHIPVNIPPITLESLAAALAGIMLMNGIYYPVYFKMGYAKAKIVSFILFFLFFFGTMSLVEEATSEMPNKLLQSIVGRFSEGLDLQAFLILVGGALVLLLASYALSLRFYNNREF
jgi:ABC-type transport system involved in multi-copper enzyme maturation permease subunit